jgi:hypothetical protein
MPECAGFRSENDYGKVVSVFQYHVMKLPGIEPEISARLSAFRLRFEPNISRIRASAPQLTCYVCSELHILMALTLIKRRLFKQFVNHRFHHVQWNIAILTYRICPRFGWVNL